MNNTAYTQEVMMQTSQIYDRLAQLPADKRSTVAMMMDAFINGMQAQERLAAGQPNAQKTAAQ